MRTVKLTSIENRAKLIPLKSLKYPNEYQAIFNGLSFRGKPLQYSVKYKTCTQIDNQLGITELDYYGWTREKLTLQGKKYEEFLFSSDKGCNIENNFYRDLLEHSGQIRHDLMAKAVTEKFCRLYHSIKLNWNPDLSQKAICLFNLFNENFTIYEGRHRVCILCHIFGDNDVEGFLINPKYVRKDFYYLRLNKRINRLLERNKNSRVNFFTC